MVDHWQALRLQVFLSIASIDDPEPAAEQSTKERNMDILTRLTAEVRHKVTHACTTAELLGAFRYVQQPTGMSKFIFA